MTLAGRCSCGMVLEWVARNPDEHMKCWGLRWCGKCGEAAVFKRDCIPCARARGLRSYRRLAQDPAYLARKRETERLRYRYHPTHANHDKARQRRRYATDPVHAAAKREAARTLRQAKLASTVPPCPRRVDDGRDRTQEAAA